MFDILFGASGSFAIILAKLVAYVVAVLFAISIHEWAHAYVANRMGDDTAKLLGRMTINPLKHMSGTGIICFLLIGFGWAKPVPINSSKFVNYKKSIICVSIAGVIANLVIAFILSAPSYFLYGIWNTETANVFLQFLYNVFYFGTIINLSLAVFNLIPIAPLDGFNLVCALFKPKLSFLTFMHQYGSLILVLLILSPLFSMLYSFVTTGIMTTFFQFWRLFI